VRTTVQGVASSSEKLWYQRRLGSESAISPEASPISVKTRSGPDRLPNHHRRDTLAGGHAASLSREFLPIRVPAMTCVRVDLGLRGYDIEIRHEAPASDFARFARTCLDATWAGRGSRSALIVTDENVDGLSRPYAEALEAIGLRTVSAVVAPGEASKSLDQAARLYERLAGAKADRHTCVVGVGGGVVGDLAGFVAATYARGLPLLMIPTSLLAQVDITLRRRTSSAPSTNRSVSGSTWDT